MSDISSETVSIFREHYPKNGLYYCMAKTGLAKAQAKNLVQQHGIKRDFSKIDPTVYADVQCPHFAYLLGFIWADGHVGKSSSAVSISIQEDDGNVLLPTLIKHCRFHVGRSVRSGGKPQTVLQVYDAAFHDFLVDNDYLVKSGASACKILARIPDHLKHYWWRGYSDGDGCFHRRKTKAGYWFSSYSITSCYAQDWTFASKTFGRLDIPFDIVPEIRRTGYRVSSLKLTRQVSIKRWGEYIYQDYGQDKIGLPRKHDKYISIASNVSERCKAKSSSQYKNVSFYPRQGRWVYDVRRNGKRFRGTYFLTEEDAYQAMQDRLSAGAATSPQLDEASLSAV